MTIGAAADLKAAWRTLRRDWRFTVPSILVLAPAIGVTTGLFSIINGLLLKALPVPNVARLVNVSVAVSGVPKPAMGLSDEAFERLSRRNVQSVTGVFGVQRFEAALSDDTHQEVVLGEAVTGNYFGTLGLRPLAGRLLTRSDDLSDSPARVVISERVWQEWFGSRPEIIGRSVFLSGQRASVVGVLPNDFHGLSMPNIWTVDAWAPAATVRPIALASDGHLHYMVFGILRAPRDLSHAEAEVRAAGLGMISGRPDLGLTLQPVGEAIAPQALMLLETFYAGVAMALGLLVLAIAAANVAILIMARASTRAASMALRVALGATPSHIVRLYLLEALLVVGASGVLGAWLAWVVTSSALPSRLSTARLALRPNAAPDSVVFLFSCAIVMGTAVILAMAAASRVARTEPQRILKTGGAQPGITARGRRRRRTLVAFQFGACTVLLIFAGLFERSAQAVGVEYFQLDTVHTAVTHVDFRLQRFDEAQGTQAYRTILGALGATPGILRAAASSGLPIAGDGLPVTVEGGRWTHSAFSRGLECRLLSVTPGFFDALGLPVKAGRGVGSQDAATGPAVVVISRAVANELWSSSNPLNQIVVVRGMGRTDSLEVVGVVDDTDRFPNVAARRFIYRPLGQSYRPSLTIVAAASGAGSSIVHSLGAVVARATPQVAAFSTEPMGNALAASASPLQLTADILLALGGLGCCVAAVGLYASFSYVIRARRSEFGVMMALGASRRHIFSTVLTEGLLVVIAGTIPATVIAFAAAGVLEPVLMAVSPHDAWTFAIVPVTIAVVGIGAASVPARQATQISIVSSIRHLA